MSRFYRFILDKSVFIYLLSFFILLLGIFATTIIKREAYPNVDFGSITISTLYLGASPEETEKFVTNEIEKNIKDIDGIDETESVSSEGRSYVALKLFPGENQQRILNDIESALGRITFPEDVEDPVVTKLDSGAFPIVTLSLSGAATYSELRGLSKQLEDKLLQIEGVGRITKSNYHDQEYRVKVVPEFLRKYYISIKDIVNSIKDRSINMPGGKIESSQSEKIVRSLGEYKNTTEIENTVIRSNDANNAIYIKDIASVEDTFVDPDSTHRINGEPTIGLTIIKKKSSDIIITIKEINALTDTFLANNKAANLTLVMTNDLSEEINRRLDILFSNAITGIIIVFIALFLFLNFKVALRVAIGIPFSILAAMIFVKSIGITINLVSLLGFILVIGMIVDNAIVVGENIYDKFEKGESAELATINGAKEVAYPIIFSTLTTVAAFSPLLLMGGLIGKFVWSIPVIVILAISASLFYALIILPNLMHNTLKNSVIKKSNRVSVFEYLQVAYEKMIKRVINVRYVVFPFFIVLLVLSMMLAATKMDFVLFPNEDAKQFNIRFEGPSDMRLDYLSDELEKIEAVLQQLPAEELENYMTAVGQISPDNMSRKLASNLGEIIVLLSPPEDRTRKSRDIIEDVRKQVTALKLTHLHITFESAQNGPPVGKPVKIDILGDDFDRLLEAANGTQDILSSVDGVIDLETSFREGKPEVRVYINEKGAAAAKLTMKKISNEVRSAMGGTIATELKRGDEEIDVRVIYEDSFRKSEDNLRRVQIPNERGQLIDIMSVVNFSNEKGRSDISHFQRKRVVSVTADINPDITTSFKVNQSITPILLELNKIYPDLHFLQRGENEDTQESISNLFIAFIFALFLIFMIIASLFNSITEPLVIMLAIPFGIIGVIWAFFFHDAPISFMMLMGTIGLSGVVVNNTIILVSVIKDFRNDGMSDRESIVQGGRARLRAVLLSSLTTLLGLFPTAYGIGGADPFIIPLCLALAWGLMFSTILTLVLLPCTYAIGDDIRGLIQRKLS